MSDKIDKKEEAQGLQYIRKYLVPFAAIEWSEEWQQLAQQLLKSIHRIDVDAPILGKGMTDLLFYRGVIDTPGIRNSKKEIIFRIGKYTGMPVVSYYHDLSESKWYRITETPDKAAIRRIMESHGWEGPDRHEAEPITKIEEQEALQFIRNVAIPYTIDHIYNVFKTFNPRAPVEDFPPLTADYLRNNLKKWQHGLPNSIVYLVEFGKDPRSYFKYYIQKVSGAFGVRVMIHHQLPMTNSNKTNDVILYIGKGRQPSWFTKLGYIKEAHNPQRGTDDINKEEEQDATSTFIQHLLPDAIHWFNRRDSFAFASDPHITTTPEEVRRGFKKVIRDKDFILFKFEKEGRLLWFGISKKIYDNHILSIGYHVGEIRQILIGYGEGRKQEDDFKTGWQWRQYQPDKKEWDVFLETMMPPGGRSDVTKKEELQAIQWIKDHLFKYIAKQIGAEEQHLRDTFRKTKHGNDIFYHSKTGLVNFEDLDFAIYKDENGRIIVDVDNGPGWHISFPVGEKQYLAQFNENELPSDPIFDINKKEEAQALQYIRSLIPRITKELNLYIASGASGIKFNVDRLTSEESLAKNLKKTEHRKQIFSSRRGPQDYIEYSSEEIGRPPVVFYIYKTEKQRGDPESGIKIAVGYKHFNPRQTGGTTSYLSENDGGKYPGESDDVYINRMVKISPREEAEGLFYIKKYLFEKAANFWNGTAAAGAYVSPEVIAANFKKTDKLYIPPDRFMERHAHEKITFESLIPRVTKKKNTIKFVFHMSKDSDGKLYVGFVPPGRDDHGLNYGLDNLRNPPHLEEGVRKIHRISRKEELEALQYIRNILGPAAVNAWNQRTMQHQMDPTTIVRQLKKIVHARPPDGANEGMNTDYIKYSVTIPVRDATLDHKVFFTFAIYKNKEDEIVVDYKTALVDGGPFTVGTNPSTGKCFVRENNNDKPNPNPHKAINKMDELRAVDFIKKLIVPLAVKRCNRTYKPNGSDSVENVRRLMKKKSHEKWPRILSDFVVYESPSPHSSITYHWEIWKDGNGMLMVGWKFNYETNLYATYFVGDTSPVDEATDPSQESRRKRMIATYSITKREEDYAADFIKKRLIPKLVVFMNDTSKHYTRHRQITVEEVLKTFKKVRSWEPEVGYKREIQYQALFLGEPFLFDIYKDSNSKLMILQKSDGTLHIVT